MVSHQYYAPLKKGPRILPNNERGCFFFPDATSTVAAQCAIICEEFILPQTAFVAGVSLSIRFRISSRVFLSNKVLIIKMH